MEIKRNGSKPRTKDIIDQEDNKMTNIDGKNPKFQEETKDFPQGLESSKSNPRKQEFEDCVTIARQSQA